MKLATPLTVHKDYRGGLWCKGRTGVIVDWEDVVADHARLTADLADAVAALKEATNELAVAWSVMDEEDDEAFIERCRALVARVEART